MCDRCGERETGLDADTKRGMERLNEKLIGGHEVTCDDRSTKVKETDVWLLICL